MVQALTRAGDNGERFTTEAIIPLKDPTDNSDTPDYQAYLALAWLRSVGLVVQHGRRGYTLPRSENLERDSDRRWIEMTTR